MGFHRALLNAVAACAIATCATGGAEADDRPATPPTMTPTSLVLGGDSLLFVWAPLAATVAFDRLVPTRETPLLFDSSEGGLSSRRDQEIPGVALSVGAVVVAGAIALGDDPTRYWHTRGLMQSLAVSGFITVAGKHAFGRHRPDYDPAASGEDGRQSFPSGHSTVALAALGYTGLYLRLHGFDQWRAPGTWPWWEVVSYAGLGALAVGFTGERVYHHRHNVSDVVAGGLVGSMTATAFFIVNERAYRRAARRGMRPSAPPAAPRSDQADAPDLSPFDAPVLSVSASF